MQQFNKFSKNIDIKNYNKFLHIHNTKIGILSNLNSPPKKRVDIRGNRNIDNTSKEEMKSNTKNENTLITTFNNDPNYEISYNDKTFEEIYDDIDEDVIRNNYLANKKQNFMKNNYLEFKRKEMFLKIKNALNPTNNQNNFLDDYNPYKKKKKKSFISETGNIVKDRLKNFLYDFDCNIKINRFNTYPKYYNWNDKNSKNDTQKNSKFSKFFDEESGFMGNERFFQPSNSSKNNNNTKSKNDDSDSDFSEENKNSDILTVNKKRKKEDDLISENKSEKSGKSGRKSDKSSSFSRKRNKKRKNDTDNEIITLKTENSDLYKERIKNNIGKSLNKENRNLKTSLLDINSSRLKLNRKNIGKGKNDENDNIENNRLLSTQTIDIIDPITKETRFCKFYVNYFMKREIFLTSFYDKDDKVAYFVRIPTFLLVMAFMFTINCLLLTTNYIHNRYIYAEKYNGINEANYVFTHEFGKSILCALISNVFKIIIIKIIYWKIFKISHKLKNELITNNNMSEEERKYTLFKKEEYFKSYKKKAIIYILITLPFIIIFAIFSINYIGTFPNTGVGILLGFILSVVLSILLCALICFIIVSFHFIGEKCEVDCFNYFYKCLKTIY